MSKRIIITGSEGLLGKEITKYIYRLICLVCFLFVVSLLETMKMALLLTSPQLTVLFPLIHLFIGKVKKSILDIVFLSLEWYSSLGI